MPSRLRFNQEDHIYWLRDSNGDRERKIISVTTLISQYAKPKLVPWAAAKAADYAVDHWATLNDMPPSERRTAIAHAADYVRDDSAAAGTQIHRWAEKLIAGRAVEVPEAYRSTVEHLARWWERAKLEAIALEAQVWSDEAMGLRAYAGTLDCLAVDRHGDYWLLDFKSGGVYESAAYQLAGYAGAQYLAVDDEDTTMPPIMRMGVLQVRPDACRLHRLELEQQQRAQTWFDNALANRTAGVPRFKLEAQHV